MSFFLHQPLHALLAHPQASLAQLTPDARPAVSAACLGMHRTNVHKQRFICQVTTLRDLRPPQAVLVIACGADPEHAALHTDRPDRTMSIDKGVSHFWPFAKNAVAFPNMSRSIVTRASSARKRRISICSAVSSAWPLEPRSLPARCALTQFQRVCSTIPRLRAASETRWPDSTRRTASCLNSSVYAFRGTFTIFVFPSQFNRSAKGYVLRGQAHSFRTGFTICVISRSLAATSCNMGVNSEKFCRL